MNNIETLIANFKSENIETREKAKESLVEAGASAVPSLISSLRSENRQVRCWSIITLGEIGNRQATEPLIEVLKGKDSDLSCYAADALGKLADLKAIKPLIEGLVDHSDASFVSEAIVDALKVIGHQAIPMLLNIFETDKNPEMRSYSIDVLGIIDAREAIDVIAYALRDEAQQVRQTAHYTLKKFSRLAVPSILRKDD